MHLTYSHSSLLPQKKKRLHNEKLYLLQSALIEREKEVEDKNAKRIEEIK